MLAAVGALALLLLALALLTRWPPLAAWAVAAAGTEYGVFLELREQVVDRWAPLVAAALFLAAELAFRLLEPREPRPRPEVVVRSTFWLVGGVLGAATVAAVLLSAAVVAVFVLVAVAFRAPRSPI